MKKSLLNFFGAFVLLFLVSAPLTSAAQQNTAGLFSSRTATPMGCILGFIDC